MIVGQSLSAESVGASHQTCVHAQDEVNNPMQEAKGDNFLSLPAYGSILESKGE